jgi:hypothetical protein
MTLNSQILMKKIFFVLLILNKIAVAQPEAIIKIASSISTESLRKNLYYLASDKMEGRLMASHGDTLASMFIADWFKRNKLFAPYQNGKNYFQPIIAYKVTREGKLIFNNTSFTELEDWIEFSQWKESRFSIKNAVILLPFIRNPDSLYNALSKINCKEKVLILSSTLSNNFTNEEEFEGFLTKLSALGIVSTIEYGPWIQKSINNEKNRSFLPHYAITTNQTIPSSVLEVGLTEEKMNELLSGDFITAKSIDETIDKGSSQSIVELKTKIGIEVKKTVQKVIAPNVIGIIKGTDPEADCIVISAHHDHDGRNGKEIYYGAVDNGSGTVAIMEIAKLMNTSIQKGLRPKRTILFASFTGEERGLLGSSYYVTHPVYPINKTYAILNIDMFGRVDTFYSGKRPDSNYVYVLVKDSLTRGLRNALYKANASLVNLKLDTYYEQPQYTQRRLTGSDQYPFYLKGVPFIRIDCGFCKDYHKPTDTPDKINYELLKKQTQLAFLTLWNISNE